MTVLALEAEATAPTPPTALEPQICHGTTLAELPTPIVMSGCCTMSQGACTCEAALPIVKAVVAVEFPVTPFVAGAAAAADPMTATVASAPAATTPALPICIVNSCRKH